MKHILQRIARLENDETLEPQEKKDQLKSFMHQEAKRLENRWQSNFTFFCMMKGRTKGVQELYHMMARNGFMDKTADEVLSEIHTFLNDSQLNMVHGRR